MAPKRRRSKVGLTRMHAALDAMRPMGFSSDVVRKCVKNLLKVYGGEGWVFIEEAAYKLLIDTILEEPHELEKAPENPMLEGGSSELLESVPELYDKQVICEEQPSALDIRAPDILGKDISTGKEKSQEQDLDVKVTPTVLQDVDAALSYTSQATDSIPTNKSRKPCYGWISDDEDDDFVQLTPAMSITELAE